LVVCSYIFPHEHTQESEKLVWKTPLEAFKGETGRGWNNFRVWLVAVLVAMVGLYWYWWGDQNYYPVQGKVTLADGTPVAGAKLFFDCDENALNFPVVTDAEGKYTYPTTNSAGGAPEGTEYRVRIVPAMDLIVQMKEEGETKKVVFDKVLYEVPAGTEINKDTLVEEQEVKDVYTFTLKTKDHEGKDKATVVHVPRGKYVKIVRATEIPDNYRTFDGSDLEITVKKVPAFTTDREQYYEGYQFELK
jgi:hypothetical protein